MRVDKTVGWLLVGLGVVLVGLVAVVLLLRSDDTEAPRWTEEANLPPLPPARDNGWIVLMGEGVPTEIPTGITTIEGAESVELELTADASLDQRWERITAEAAKIRERVEANEPARRRWHAAADAPHFVDACPVTVGALCNYYEGHLVHQEALAEVLDLALARDFGAADRNLARILDVDRRYLETCRGLLGCVVAVADVEATLGATALVLKQQDDVDQSPSERHRLLRAVEEHRSIEPVAVRERMVIGHYVRMRNILELMTKGEGEGVQEHGSWLPALLFDPGKTSRVLDELHHELMEHVHGRSVAEPVEWSSVDRIFNALGVELVDLEMLRVLIVNQLDSAATDLDQIARHRDDILERWGEPTAGRP